MVVTNQSAIARGIIDEAFLDQVHPSCRRAGARRRDIDRYYYCPHLSDAPVERYRQTCRCRKPGPGMIEQACREMDLDPARSFMVGDRGLDVGLRCRRPGQVPCASAPAMGRPRRRDAAGRCEARMLSSTI